MSLVNTAFPVVAIIGFGLMHHGGEVLARPIAPPPKGDVLSPGVRTGVGPQSLNPVPASNQAPATPGLMTATAPPPGGDQPATNSTDAEDPFARLRVVVPPEQLGPIRSVRVGDNQEAEDRSRLEEISVKVESMPTGVEVLYGGKPLGRTPLILKAKRGSTPLDVIIRRSGYMTLHTRIRRKLPRSYFFKLTPAKF